MKPRNERPAPPRPFLKWAGGKGQLLDELMVRVDKAGQFERYHEPFIGGGALFFHLCRLGRLGRKQAYLSDSNERLIEAYIAVRDHAEDVIGLLRQHAAAHGHDYYYEVRARVPKTVPERAARIIYLNRTCFNGLYRENSRGEFNVPIGKYANPTICDAENLRAVSAALKKAHIESRPFDTVLDHAQPGDFVYFDPPYHPVSKTSSFTKYAKDDFSEEDQRRLAGVFAKLAENRVKVLLSNSMTPLVQSLYKSFRIDEIFATRAVNSRADRRGKISEALVRSF